MLDKRRMNCSINSILNEVCTLTYTVSVAGQPGDRIVSAGGSVAGIPMNKLTTTIQAYTPDAAKMQDEATQAAALAAVDAETLAKGNAPLAFAENLYTAPASLTGLPAVVAGGVQLIGPAFSEERLLAVATRLEEVRR